MLPREIKELIFDFHDEFGLIEKKQQINHIIKCSYQNWLKDAGCYSRFFSIDEYTCKKQIYPYISPHMCITNRTCWGMFLQYFTHFERYCILNKLPCLPSCYSQI